MLAIDSLPIEGMKKADLYQLRQMFEHVVDEGVYWDRKDYWDKRISNLTNWFDKVDRIINDPGVVIKGVE